MTQPKSLEQEIKAFLARKKVSFEEACSAFDRLDFCMHSAHQRGDFYFDAKEKLQPLNLANWPPVAIPQEHLFILDDLAIRKVLRYAPNSGLMVRDNLRRQYFFFSVAALALMPRLRVNRPLDPTASYSTPPFREGQGVGLPLKGKWLIDLRCGVACASLRLAFDAILAYLDAQDDIFFNHLPCYGEFPGEDIPIAGQPRQPGHWIHDVGVTR